MSLGRLWTVVIVILLCMRWVSVLFIRLILNNIYTSKLAIRTEWVESNLYKPSSRALNEPSWFYTNTSYLIYEHIIMFTNNSFIFWTEIKSSLSEPSRTEFMSNRAHLMPLESYDYYPHPRGLLQLLFAISI
jgi:hypothetical protein